MLLSLAKQIIASYKKTIFVKEDEQIYLIFCEFYEYLDQIASLYYSESQSSTSTFNKLTDINPMLTLYMNTLK